MLYWEKKHDFVMRKNLSKLSRWAYSGLEVLEILFMGDEQAKLRWHLIEMTWGNVGVGKTLCKLKAQVEMIASIKASLECARKEQRQWLKPSDVEEEVEIYSEGENSIWSYRFLFLLK